MLDEQDVLIVGARRIKAAESIGWAEIGYIRFAELDEITKLRIELEENIRRKALTYLEEVKAKARIVAMMLEQGTIKVAARGRGVGKTNIRAAAEVMEERYSGLSEDLQVAEMMEEDKDAFVEGIGRNEALRVAKQIKLRKAYARYAELTKDSKQTLGSKVQAIKIIHGNMLQVEVPLPLPSLVITDPPYGIDVAKTMLKGRERRIEFSYFSDEELEVRELIPDWLQTIHNCTTEDAHIYFFSSIQNYTLLRDVANVLGWQMDPVPIIWHNKVQGTALNPEVYHARVWEPIFFFRKGKKPIINTRPNYINIPGMVESIHPTEKPKELFTDLAERSYAPGDVLFDPFAGTGTLGEVAFWMDVPCILIEIDKANINVIETRMAKLDRIEHALTAAVMIDGEEE